jgi:hypothetical protein
VHLNDRLQCLTAGTVDDNWKCSDSKIPNKLLNDTEIDLLSELRPLPQPADWRKRMQTAYQNCFLYSIEEILR